MKVVLCLSVLSAFVAVSSAANVVCYFNSWTVYRNGNGKFVPQNIDPNLCSHVLFAFVGLNSDGSVHILDEWEAINLNGIRDLINLKIQNPNLKILVSMGGWNEGSAIYSAVIGNPILRSVFVKNVVNFISVYGFDGFDLSWEYPNGRGGVPTDVQNHLALLTELKTAFGNRILSIGGAGLITQIDLSYDVPNVSKTVDMINIMTYDFHGSYDGFVAHPSALYPSHLDVLPTWKATNVNSSVMHWIEKGADPKKLNVGIVTYGRGYTLTDPSRTDLYSPTSGASTPGPYTQEAGMMGFNEACEFLLTWNYVFDQEQKVPHISSGNQWIGYEDIDSVAAKAQYAKDNGLGGVAVWSLDTDDFNGICGSGKFPLINKIKSILQ